jgi:hypothetical protein
LARIKKTTQELDLNIYTQTGKLRQRKRKQSRNYFTQDTEDAVLQYVASTDSTQRNRIFDSRINESFHKLAENIINTFKFYYMEVDNVQELKHEVVAFIIQKLNLFDPAKGKAYSYFGTIAKRYLIQYNDTNYKKLKVRADLDEVDEDKKVYQEIVNAVNEPKLSEFINSYIRFVESKMNSFFPDAKEQEIADAVLTLFRRRENIDLFNKQVFYLHIREITKQNTPAITKVVKKMKRYYKDCLNEVYLNGCLETDEFETEAIYY